MFGTTFNGGLTEWLVVIAVLAICATQIAELTDAASNIQPSTFTIS